MKLESGGEGNRSDSLYRFILAWPACHGSGCKGNKNQWTISFYAVQVPCIQVRRRYFWSMHESFDEIDCFPSIPITISGAIRSCQMVSRGFLRQEMDLGDEY